MTDKLYHSIGEVSQMLHVNPSLLRFWETEFPAIKPHKNKKGTGPPDQIFPDLLLRQTQPAVHRIRAL